jgi:membrane-associated phospholipid phosphatase
MDIFHGKEKTPKYYSKKAYGAAIFLAIFWATTIPYTRYVLGAHSLNQIVYGITLGIWAGITMHFLVRDHIISHV